MNKSHKNEQDNAGVKFPPPLIYATAIVLGIGLERLWSLNMQAINFLHPVGIGLIGLSFLLAASGFREFARAQTAIRPDRPTSAIMSTGPYRFTRNPLYLALALLQVGIGLVLGNGWVVILVVPVLFIITFYVIHREEAYLERKFGAEYLAYKSSVRRWV